MKSELDQLPRIFQANLYRFYERVITPGMSLPTHKALQFGEAETLAKFLDAAAAQVDNYTANEAGKAFTLILASLFERQLRTWARELFPPDRKPDVKDQPFVALLIDCAAGRDVDISYRDVQSDLEEAQLVANVVRHGDGRTCTTLQAKVPALWAYDKSEYVALSPGPSPMSEQMRVRPADVTRYVLAGFRFWGLVDRLPMAIVEPPDYATCSSIEDDEP